MSCCWVLDEVEHGLHRVLCIIILIALIALVYTYVLQPALNNNEDESARRLLRAWRTAAEKVKSEAHHHFNT